MKTLIWISFICLINFSCNKRIDYSENQAINKIESAKKRKRRVSNPSYLGLKNTGNSCFANSVHKMLWAMPEFINKLKNRESDLNDLGKSLVKLMKKLNSIEKKKKKSKSLESLSINLYDNMNKSYPEKYSFGNNQEQESPVEYFRDLIQGSGDSVTELLDGYYYHVNPKEELIQIGIDDININSLQNALDYYTKNLIFWLPEDDIIPRYLIIELKRYNKDNEKIVKNIEINEIIKFNIYNSIERSQMKEISYFTKAVISHRGSTINSGHYVTFIKNLNSKKWTLHNDEDVSIVSNFPNEINKNAYLVLLELKN